MRTSPTIRPIHGLLSIALLVPTTVAQDAGPARETSLTRVVDSAGQPVSDARVSFWHAPTVGFDALGPSDVFEARTDARGRLRAKLLQGFVYSAQATWKGPSGALHASAIVEGCVATRNVTLREARVAPAFRVRTDGDGAAFGRRGEIEVRVSLPGRFPRVVFSEPLDGEEIQIPQLPIGDRPHVLVSLHDSVGLLRVVRHTPAKEQLLRLALDPPSDVVLQVRGADGRPCAGATVLLDLLADDYRPLATREVAVTRADGSALVPFSPGRVGKRGHAVVRVRAAGHAESLLQILGERVRVDGGPPKKRALDAPIAVALRAATRPIVVEVLGKDGRPIPKLALECTRQAWLKTGPGGRSSFWLAGEAARTDEDGQHRWNHFPADINDLVVRAWLTPEQLPRLADVEASGFPLPGSVIRIVPRRDRRNGEAIPATFDARAKRLVRAIVRDRDGSPVPGARFFLGTETATNDSMATSDRRGRVVSFANDRSDSLAFFEPQTGFAIVGLGPREGEMPVLEVELQPFATQRCRVTRGGEGVANARFHRHGWSWSGRSEHPRALVQVIFDSTLAELRTDGEGYCTLPFIETPDMSANLTVLDAQGNQIQAGLFLRASKALRIFVMN